MAYLRWSNSPFYVYWTAVDDEDEHLMVHLNFEDGKSFSYTDLKANSNLVHSWILSLDHVPEYLPEDLMELQTAVYEFLEDIDEHLKGKLSDRRERQLRILKKVCKYLEENKDGAEEKETESNSDK